jgi:hypothetical protein
MAERWINRGKSILSPEALRRIEQHHAVVYLGDFAVPLTNGNWSDQPYPVFWQEILKQPDHKHYITIYPDGDDFYIADATGVAAHAWDAVPAQSGEVIYSRFHHDYRESHDGSVFVDGGADYFRCGGVLHDTRRLQIRLCGPALAIFEVVGWSIAGPPGHERFVFDGREMTDEVRAWMIDSNMAAYANWTDDDHVLFKLKFGDHV